MMTIGLDETHYKILSALNNNSPLFATELERICKMTKKEIQDKLQTLYERGMIRRVEV